MNIQHQESIDQPSPPVSSTFHRSRTTSIMNTTVIHKKRTSTDFRLQMKSTQHSINSKDLKNPLVKLMCNPNKSLQVGKKIFHYIKDYIFFKRFFKAANINYQDEETIYYLVPFKSGQVIFKQGSQSNDQMYVCITGRIAVVVSRNKKQIQNQQDQACQTPSSKLEEANITGLFGEHVNEITEGEGFGEKALLSETVQQAVRAATCVALSDSILLSLDRESFQEVIQQFKSETRERINILKSVIPLFENISSINTVENLMYSFKDDIVDCGSYITVEGQVGEFIYLLTQGEVSVNQIWQKQNIVVALLSQDSKEFIGDELLCSESKVDHNTTSSQNPYYKYSVKVTSQTARFLKISLSIISFRTPAECLNGIRKLYKKKEKARQEFIESKYDQVRMQRGIQTDQTPFTELDLNKNDNEELSRLSLTRNIIVQQSNDKNFFDQNLSTTYLTQFQKQEAFERLKIKIISNLLKLKGTHEKKFHQNSMKKICNEAKQLDEYKTDDIVQKMIDGNFDEIFENNIEDVKKYLIEHNFINHQKISLKTNAQTKLIPDNIDLEQINQDYKNKQKVEVNSNSLGFDFNQDPKKNHYRLIQQGQITAPPLKYNHTIADVKSYCITQNFLRTEIKFNRNVNILRKSRISSRNSVGKQQIIDLDINDKVDKIKNLSLKEKFFTSLKSSLTPYKIKNSKGFIGTLTERLNTSTEKELRANTDRTIGIKGYDVNRRIMSLNFQTDHKLSSPEIKLSKFLTPQKAIETKPFQTVSLELNSPHSQKQNLFLKLKVAHNRQQTLFTDQKSRRSKFHPDFFQAQIIQQILRSKVNLFK